MFQLELFRSAFISFSITHGLKLNRIFEKTIENFKLKSIPSIKRYNKTLLRYNKIYLNLFYKNMFSIDCIDHFISGISTK